MDKVIILDFGSQVTQLIARRVRELEIYCEIIPFHKPVPEDEKIAAVILSGSPSSVRETNHPTVDFTDLFNKYPVLGICYGAQLMASTLGGAVQVSDKREYGRANLKQLLSDPIWDDVEPESQVWMSHSDTITSIPPDFQIIGSTDSIPVAAIKASKSKFPVYAFQFHPEVMHTLFGKVMLGNFLKKYAESSPTGPQNHI